MCCHMIHSQFQMWQLFSNVILYLSTLFIALTKVLREFICGPSVVTEPTKTNLD